LNGPTPNKISHAKRRAELHVFFNTLS